GRRLVPTITYGCAATDAPRTDHDIVEVALLGLRGTGIPVVLEEDGVDPVGVIRAYPVQIGGTRLELVVDPILEDTIRLARIVQANMRLHAVPLIDAGTLEDGRPPLLDPEPTQVGEIVVATG